MVDHVKALGYKITLPKAVVFTFTLLLFFYIAPIDSLNILRQISFEGLVIAFWLGVVGFGLFIEGLASIPETKRGTSKAGASILIGLGFTAFTFGAISMIAGYDILRDSAELRTITTILFGGASIVFFITLIPEVFSRQSFVARLRNV